MRAAAADEPVGVIVRHKPDVFAAQRVVTDAHVTHSYRLIPATALRVRAADIEALSRRAAIVEGAVANSDTICAVGPIATAHATRIIISSFVPFPQVAALVERPIGARRVLEVTDFC